MASRVLARLTWLAALLVAAWILTRPAMAEARRRLVVLELEGDQAEDFQGELEKFLKKSHSVVPRKKWLATAEDLAATKLNDKNVKKVARKLSIDGVISGSIEKRGARFYVSLQLRDGTTGKTVATTELVERAARFSTEGKSSLTDELLAAIDELDSAGDDGGDDEADDDDGGFGRGQGARGKGRDADDDEADDEDDGLTAKQRAARDKAAKAKAAKDKAARDKAAKDKRRRGVDDDDEFVEDDDDDRGRSRDRVADDDDDENPLGDEADIELEGDDVDAMIDPRVRPVDLSAGLSFTARRLSFSTDAGARAPLGYKSDPVPGVYVAADLFPLAFNRKNRSITRNLGLSLVFDRVIKIDSQYQSGGKIRTLASTEQHVGFGVLYRHLVGTKITVNASIHYNKRKFVIDKSAEVMREDVDIPDVDYSYVDPGLGVRYVVGPKIAIGGDARFLLITDTGAMQAPEQYGGAKVTGVDLGGRFDYQIGAKLLVRATAGLTRIGFTFTGNGTLTNNRETGTVDLMTREVSGASDTYFGGTLTGVYLF